MSVIDATDGEGCDGKGGAGGAEAVGGEGKGTKRSDHTATAVH